MVILHRPYELGSSLSKRLSGSYDQETTTDFLYDTSLDQDDW